METESLRAETPPILKEPFPAAEDREKIIQACYELLCSERPLSEVLVEAKRLSVLRKSVPIAGPAPVPMGPAGGSSQADNRPAEVTEATPWNLVEYYRPAAPSSGESSSNATDHRRAPEMEQPPANARDSQSPPLKIGWAIGRFSFWLVTAICSIIPVGTSGIWVPPAPVETAAALPVPAETGIRQPSQDIPARMAVERDDATKISPPPDTASSAAPAPGKVTDLFEEFKRQYLTPRDGGELAHTQLRAGAARPSVPERGRAHASPGPDHRSMPIPPAAGGVGSKHDTLKTPAYVPAYPHGADYSRAPFVNRMSHPNPPRSWDPYWRLPYPVPPQNAVLQYDTLIGRYVPLAGGSAPPNLLTSRAPPRSR